MCLGDDVGDHGISLAGFLEQDQFEVLSIVKL